MHLLREHRKNGQIISSILSAASKESQQNNATDEEDQTKRNKKDEQNAEKQARKYANPRLSSVLLAEGMAARRNRRRQVNEGAVSVVGADGKDLLDEVFMDLDQPDPSKVTQLVRDIAKLRNEMSVNKKVELKRKKTSFQDLLRVVHAQEKRGSESDTYTDGSCALLRRKMHKLRNPDDFDSGLEVSLDTGKGEFKIKHSLPKIDQKKNPAGVPQSFLQTKKKAMPATRSFSSVPTISRQQALLGESEETMKKQLEAQERYQTEVKVANEIQKFQRIQNKIYDFLERQKKKTVYPLIYDHVRN
ncbi:hypothetical protein EGW08_012195 [Elysia chlorotica]|uniref:Uncharacterized protein n=1 Tax=Elysia chlorotica TaxID=188477 RepID=A0A433TEN3_ELYCH|nr:hypothetical protein EGW08_012195 [Elysia chlorotica]